MRRIFVNILIATALQAQIKSEFIYETAPFPSCHASTIVETAGGLVTAFFGGTAERNPDVGIWVSRLVRGKWTAPVEVANGVESATVRYPTWNPVLFQPKSGPLLLFYKVGPSPSTWRGMVMTSGDHGATWSRPRALPDGILGPIKDKPVQLANGDIVSPSSTENDGWRVHFERSSDLGKTWTSTGPLNGKEIQAIQPTLLTHKDGRLQALGRTKSGKIFSMWSADGGKTWGKIETIDLPNPSSGIDAVTLRDGRHLLIYNHSATARSPLNVAISVDGIKWQMVLTLEDALVGQYSYPAVIQSSDGLVHVTYTWKRERIKHVVIDPAKFAPIAGAGLPAAWIGTWELNRAGSKFEAFLGPGMAEGRAIVAQRLRIEGTGGQFNISGNTTFSDGQSQEDPPMSLPLDGGRTVVAPGASVSLTLVDDRTIDVVGRANHSAMNYVSVGHFVLSADGKTLTERKSLTEREVVAEGRDPATGGIVRAGVHTLVFRRK